MNTFLILLASPIVLLLSLSALFGWAAKGKTVEE
ncbi:cytochrome bd oxidase small subunit CydS [Ferviditalea candida]